MKTTLCAVFFLTMLAWRPAVADDLPVVPLSVLDTRDARPGSVSFPVQTAPAAGTPAASEEPRADVKEHTSGRVPLPAAPVASRPAEIPRAEPPPPPLKVPVNERTDIPATPGVTEIIPVALGQLNRLVTPFEHPEIKTTSQASTRIDDNIVYVAPRTEAPVGLYISEKGDESVALSVTLIPKRIPSREIRLSLGGPASMTGPSGLRARNWEESYPYEESVRNLLRTLAQEKLPQGYSMAAGVPLALRTCKSREASRAGVIYDYGRGQTVIGSHFEVVIGLVRNTGAKPVELKETWCAASRDVAAVAYWPEVVLDRDKAAEVYVVLRHTPPGAHELARPSLLEGAP